MKRIIIDLSGEWDLSDAGGLHHVKASVPGCVHTDLHSAGVIPDPYYRDNEDRLQWVGEAGWSYKRQFEISTEAFALDRMLMQCDGLDTFARIVINGTTIAKTDNMFRSWEMDIKERVHVGSNEIEVIFESVIPYGKKRQEERYFHEPMFGKKVATGRNWVRKEQCNFGWDWGPTLVTCGIWRPIRIVSLDTVRIKDLHVRQVHSECQGVDLLIDLSTERPGSASRIDAKARLLLGNEEVATGEFSIAKDGGSTELVVSDPQLWWPNGMGEQPLYRLDVAIYDDAGILLDEKSTEIGLRTLELIREDDAWGESFRFRANGRDFFAKGANWIPADTFDTRVSDADLRDLLQSAVDANMNMIRVWGGGIYERDIFYSICDELGLCVWQDFMFACAAYPAVDEEFMESVREEASENVKRLRLHPCLAVWCGNNELEQIPGIIGDNPGGMSWTEYSRLFDKLLADVVRTFDPERAYWPSSEHTPKDDRTHTSDPRSGDAHCWAVWHGGQPFEWYHTSFHRFCSEFGFQSFALPATIASTTLPEDRNITSYVMERHQKCPMGNGGIIRQMLNWFRLPVGFENTVWLSHILQALAIKYAVEHWRRNMPRCMGSLYWQLNDCWPATSWSSIDSNHRWKALHYDAKRFYSPYLVSAVEDPENNLIDIHLTSDRPDPVAAKVSLFLDTVDGKTVHSEVMEATTPVNGSTQVGKFDLSEQVAEYSHRNLIAFLSLELNGEIVSRNMTTFARPKHINLRKPSLSFDLVRFEATEAEFTIASDKPALWVWLNFESHPDVRWSDNFFHLRPGEERHVRVTSRSDVPFTEDLLATLRLRDLTDTYA